METEFSHTLSAYIPSTAPTAPKFPRLSMTLASHSTVPRRLKLEPIAALVWELFCVEGGRDGERGREKERERKRLIGLSTSQT